MRPIVIIGGGHAAFACINSLVQRGMGAQITLISAEPDLPYRRPPLSKEYLSGQMQAAQLLQRPDSWYEKAGIETRLGQPVEALEVEARQVALADGSRLPYQQLVLATGARARTLPASISGEFTNLYTLRNRADADALREQLRPKARLLVVGGGFLGLEAAAAARAQGMPVQLIEADSRILARVAAAPTANYFHTLHRDNGVEIHTGVTLAALHGSGQQARQAQLDDGRQLPFDILLACIGADPVAGLAANAGLEIENGILVDGHCRTSNPDIYAAGDCTAWRWRGQLVRLESVQNAQAQGGVVAANLAGEASLYQPAPWFWSNQYRARLQIAGLNTGYTQAIPRHEQEENALSVWYYRDNELIAVDAINTPKTYAVARRLLSSAQSPSPASVAALSLEEMEQLNS